MRQSVRTLLVAGLSTLVVSGSAVTGAVGLWGQGSPASTRLNAVAASAAKPAALAAEPVDVLKQDLDKILDVATLADGQASVEVRDASDGTVLYARDAAERLQPASNNKLFTSAAAMEVLGSGFTFTTDALTVGTRSGGTLTGDLYLRGSGDPSLLASDLDALAKTIRASGITKVTGKLIPDAFAFDRTPLGDSWGWDDESAYYAAPISALTVSPDDGYNTASVVVDVTPGVSAGSPAKVRLLLPTGYVIFSNHTTTGAAGTANTIGIERIHGTNTILVTGSIPLGGAAKRSIIAVSNPTAYAATLFREALVKNGVSVLGKTVEGRTPTTAKVAASHKSKPLSSLMVPFLKYSNNGHAELLLKAMGRKAKNDGSWAGGLSVLSTTLGGLGVESAKLRLADGSGLSRKNITAAHQLTSLLIAARGKPWFDAWYNALPIAGNPDPLVGGTLASRMKGTAAEGNVHGKTGSLTGATALSGYVTDKDGKPLVFSIVHNNFVGSSPKSVEDQIAIRLANFTRAPVAGLKHSIPVAPKTNYGPSDVECSWVRAC